jgi:hypothetical protein
MLRSPIHCKLQKREVYRYRRRALHQFLCLRVHWQEILRKDGRWQKIVDNISNNTRQRLTLKSLEEIQGYWQDYPAETIEAGGNIVAYMKHNIGKTNAK